MYRVEQAEPTEEFKKAWSAAGRHLGPLGGAAFNWLRADLNSPMAEHLSFRMANQLFFVFVVAAEFKFEGWRDLFLRLCREANATPCLLLMNETLTGYEPANHSWGLMHVETGEAVDPSSMVSDELIEMTDWELHDFAIQVVKTRLKEQGLNVFAAQSSTKIDPSIWYEEDDKAYWVVVREVRHPESKAAVPENIGEVADSSSRKGEAGYFASVKIASNEDPFDPNAAQNGNYLPLYRGHGMMVGFEGLEPIE